MTVYSTIRRIADITLDTKAPGNSLKESRGATQICAAVEAAGSGLRRLRETKAGGERGWPVVETTHTET